MSTTPSPPRRPTSNTIAFPDVCKTPAPGGPIPVPYPNVGQTSKTTLQQFKDHMRNLQAAGAADAGAATGNPTAAGKKSYALEQLLKRSGIEAKSAIQAVLIGRATW